MSGPLVTAFAGIYMSKKPWKHAHKKWFKELAEELDKPELNEWVGKDNYWPGVFEAAKIKLPKATEEERVVWARKQYFRYVLEYIEENHINLNNKLLSVLEQVQAPIVVGSSTPPDVINKLLEADHLSNMIYAVHTSPYQATDQTNTYYENIIKEHGMPKAYLGTDSEESLAYWTEKDVPVAAVQLDDASKKDVSADVLTTAQEIQDWLKQQDLI